MEILRKRYEKEQQVLRKLEEHGWEAWFVGGCVRDALRGKPCDDIDITTNATPQEVTAVFGEKNIIETGLAHGTVTVKPQMAEVTTYRTEGKYSDHRHPDQVTFVRSLREDLKRRDFTINAMAMDCRGHLEDPFGGQEDLEKGVIRAVGDPAERFDEDPLRILRALRFASVLGFVIEADTAKALRGQRELLGCISVERIFKEFCKTLTGRDAAKILREFFPVWCTVIPELEPLENFQQNNPHHDFDVLEHTLRSVETAGSLAEDAGLSAKDKRDLVMTMLFHDIGKPEVYSEDEEGVGHFYRHESVSGAICRRILHRLKADGETIRRVSLLVKYHGIEWQEDRRFLKRRLHKFGVEDCRMLLMVRTADLSGQKESSEEGGLPRWRSQLCRIERVIDEILSEEQCFSRKDLKIDGRDLINDGVAAGPELGRILNQLLEWVIDEEVPNEREALLEKSRQIR